jgi:hypothetical protein
MHFLGIYDGPGGRLLLDATARGARKIVATTSERGFEHLTATIPLRLSEAYAIYDYGQVPWVRYRAPGRTIWEGRLAKPELFIETEEGLRLGAMGAVEALDDLPYTTLWSDTSLGRWFVMDRRQRADNMPERFDFALDGVVRISAKNGETYGNAPNVVARVGYLPPDRGLRTITHIRFEQDTTLTADWQVGLQSFTPVAGNPLGAIWTFVETVWTQTTGSITPVALTLPTPAAAFAIYCFRNANPNAAYTPSTGADTLLLTNVRVSSQALPVTVADIARHMIGVVSATNPSQLSSIVAAVNFDSSALPDLTDEVYSDASMLRVLDRLAQLGDSAGAALEYAVWEDRILMLRRRGLGARRWHAEVASLQLRRTLDAAANSIYVTHRDAAGATVRTAAAVDAASVARLNMTRQAAVTAQTTSTSLAERIRDTALADRAVPFPEAATVIRSLQDGAGARYPADMLRAGHEVSVRVLPSALGTGVDRLRTFRVTHTTYDGDSDTVAFEPETPLPTLPVQIARQEAGLS